MIRNAAHWTLSEEKVRTLSEEKVSKLPSVHILMVCVLVVEEARSVIITV